MRKFIINNHKGGSCKTTSAVNLGAALAEKGKKVLLIDLDPQGSASIWFGQKRIQKGESLFSQDAEPGLVDRITIPTETENLFLIPNISIKERNNKDTKQSASRGNVLKTRL
ncbi:MAG: AAA family ATPase, partial [Leptospiraceae bacterium]|nr:AAA family ATPase [Leptospiraceae bacterium]